MGERYILINEDDIERVMQKLDDIERRLEGLSRKTEPDIIGPDEAAEILGLKNINSLYRKVRQGEVPALRNGRLMRFDRAEVLLSMGKKKDERDR